MLLAIFSKNKNNTDPTQIHIQKENGGVTSLSLPILQPSILLSSRSQEFKGPRFKTWKYPGLGTPRGQGPLSGPKNLARQKTGTLSSDRQSV